MRTRSARVCAGLLGATGAVALAVVSWGCKLDKPSGPNLQGPSDVGVSVYLAAAPDTVNADGVSTSQVSLVLHNNLGEPLVNWPILFQCDCDGRMLPAPGSLYVGPVQTGKVMATDGTGSTAVVYTAGRGIGSVHIFVRPYATDTQYTPFDRSVEIVQR
jgi:hypothetical protein